MITDIEKLPCDILRKTIIDLRDKYTDLENQLVEKTREMFLLNEENKLLKYKLFGRRSEKLSNDDKSPGLFNEAELSQDGFVVDEEESRDNEIVIKEHKRKKRGRKPLPKDLPREEIVHDLSEAEKECDCCGKKRPQIGKEVTEELSIIPAKIYVKKHIRYKYGPCSCEKSLNNGEAEIKIAAMPNRMIPGSIASPELLSYIFVSKYCDGLPFYRLEKIIKRYGVELIRATMCNWAIKSASKCSDLIDLMWQEIRSGPLISMDETTLQVLNEPDRPATSKSYMWVTLGYPDSKPIIIYHYHPTRSKEVPVNILSDYKGYLQTDGYSGYNEVGKFPEIVHVGCFAHSRRKFDEALKVSKKEGSAKVGLSFIQELYRIEKELRPLLENREITQDEFVKKRKELANPILDKLNLWLNKKIKEVPPETLIGKAINYTLKEWPKLIKYLDAWFLTPDNNRAENAIRPFVIGRKNWLFSNTPSGAHASATLYSLIETAKKNGLEPYWYLYYLFTKLPRVSSVDELKKLLPTNLTTEQLKAEGKI